MGMLSVVGCAKLGLDRKLATSATSTSTASSVTTATCTLSATSGFYLTGDTLNLSLSLLTGSDNNPTEISSVEWSFAVDGANYSAIAPTGSGGSYSWTLPAVSSDPSGAKVKAQVTGVEGPATNCTATITRIVSKVEQVRGFLYPYGVVDGTGTGARVTNPVAPTYLAASKTSYFFDSNIIRKLSFDADGNATLTYFSGSGLLSTPNFTNGTATASRYTNIRAMANDGTYIYAADQYGRVIRKIAIADGSSTTLTGADGTGAVPASTTHTDGLPGTAVIRWVSGMTYAGGFLWIGDRDVVRKVDITTGEVTTVAGVATSGATTDGDGTAARFSNISSFTTDATYLYIHDGMTLRRMTLTAPYTVSTLAGGYAEQYKDGVGSGATITQQVNFFNDAMFYLSGAIYFTDGSFHTVRKLELSSNTVTTLAGGYGQTGAIDGIGSAARFAFDSQLGGVVLGGDHSKIYIGMYGLIRKIDLATHEVSTLAGSVADMNTLLGGNRARFQMFGGGKIGNSFYYGANLGGSNNSGYNPILKKWDLDANQISTVGGSLTSYAQTDGTLNATARFKQINGAVSVGGTVYISDFCSIRKIDGSGNVSLSVGAYDTTWMSSCGYTDGVGAAARITGGYINGRLMTAIGTNIYRLEPIAGNAGCLIRKIDLSDAGNPAASVLAGSSNCSSSSVDGTGAAAVFYGLDPNIATDGTYLYVAQSDHTIRRISTGGVVETVAGLAGTSGSTDGIGSAARFNYPGSILYDSGYLYVLDSNGLRKINVSTLAVNTLIAPMAANTVALNFIHNGKLIHSQNANLGQLVWQLDLTTLAFSLVSERFGIPGEQTDGQAMTTEANHTEGYTSAIKSGDWFYAMSAAAAHQVLWKMDSTGTRNVVGGVFNSRASYPGSPSLSTSLGAPYSAAIIGNTAYLTSNSYHDIRTVNLATGSSAVFAGTTSTFGSADGTGTAASFKNPTWIVTDGASLYVADMTNRTLRKIDPATGAVTTLLGSVGLSGNTDGTGSAARLGSITGMVWHNGALYLSDGTDFTVRKVTFDGSGHATVAVVAGQTGVQGTTDGVSTAASFRSVGAMTSDGTHIYIVDTGRLRRFTPTTSAVKSVYGDTIQTGFANGSLNEARGTGTPVFDSSTQSILLFGSGGVRAIR